MWHALKRRDIEIGREQTRRIMALAGVAGKRKGKNPVTTRKGKDVDTRPDLVQRYFKAMALNRLWVADITYVRTAQGFVYAAFVTDVYSRTIVGWALSDSMSTDALPLQALNQAIWNAKSTSGLVHHSDHGSQYVSLTYHKHLVDAGIMESTGSVGDSYDNALAENVNGSYKNEIIHTRRWADVLEVEIATFEWVYWWNTRRLHQALDYRTPDEVETEYWQQHQLSATIENRVKHLGRKLGGGISPARINKLLRLYQSFQKQIFVGLTETVLNDELRSLAHELSVIKPDNGGEELFGEIGSLPKAQRPQFGTPTEELPRKNNADRRSAKTTVWH